MIFILFIFLFVGDIQHQHRLIKDIWNSGHLLLFALLSYHYFSHTGRSKHSLLYKIIFTSIVCLILGLAIEALQLLVHREFSRSDLINNIIGGYLGLLLLVIFKPGQSLKLRSLLIVLFIAILLFSLRDMGKHLIDEYMIRKQFPVLASFENELETQRWEHALTDISLSTLYTSHGKYSLKTIFLPGRYPNISLKHFIKDWSGFQHLIFSVYNPEDKAVKLEMKIYDKQHISAGRRYIDRFNQPVTIQPGWNTIKTSIDSIITAPKNRTMNIYQINSFSLFTDKLKHPVTLYIDNIHLL